MIQRHNTTTRPLALQAVAVAENKLGMMKKKKIQAPEIGASTRMLKLFGSILPTTRAHTSFLGVNSYHSWKHTGDFRCFLLASKTSFLRRQLKKLHIHIDSISIIPTTRVQAKQTSHNPMSRNN